MEEEKVLASCCITNIASLNIYDLNDRAVKIGLNNEKPRWRKIYSTSKGHYVKWGGSRYYLSEFIKIN